MLTEPIPPSGYFHTFTICPTDEQQHVNSPCRINMVSNHIRTILYDTIGDVFYYNLFTEISEPQIGQDSVMARIHFHGVISLSPEQKVLFYAEYFHKLSRYFRFEVDTIKYEVEKFLIYCTKQRDGMEKYCMSYKTEYMIHHKMGRPQGYDAFSRSVTNTKRSRTNRNKPIGHYFTQNKKEGSGDSSPVLCDDDL